MTLNEIKATAAKIKKLGVPDSLNRWIGMTPKALAANQAARDKLNVELRKGATMSIGPKEQAVRDARLSEADKKAIADLASGQAQKKEVQTANRIAKLKAKKNGESVKMPAQGKDALKVIAAGEKCHAVVDDPALHTKLLKATPPVKLPETTAPLADLSAKELKKHAPDDKAQKLEAARQAHNEAVAKATAVKPAKAAPEPKAKAKAAPKAPAKAASGKSKTEIALAMLKKGATRKAIAEATNWPSINLKPIAKRHGLKLKEKDGVFHAA